MHIVLFHPDQPSTQPQDQTDSQTVEQHKDAKQTVTRDQPQRPKPGKTASLTSPSIQPCQTAVPTTGVIGQFRRHQASGKPGCLRGARFRVGALCPAAEAAYRPLPPNLSTAAVTVFLHCHEFLSPGPCEPRLPADLDSSELLRASSPRARNTWIPSVIRPAANRTLRQTRTSR